MPFALTRLTMVVKTKTSSRKAIKASRLNPESHHRPTIQAPTLDTFRFLDLPGELRLRIYRHLLHCSGNKGQIVFSKISRNPTLVAMPTLTIDDLPNSSFQARIPVSQIANSFYQSNPVRDDLLDFTLALQDEQKSTWSWEQQGGNLEAGARLLRSCRLVHLEALPVLYGENEFVIESDLKTPPEQRFLRKFLKSNVKSIRHLRIIAPLDFGTPASFLKRVKGLLGLGGNLEMVGLKTMAFENVLVASSKRVYVFDGQEGLTEFMGGLGSFKKNRWNYLLGCMEKLAANVELKVLVEEHDREVEELPGNKTMRLLLNAKDKAENEVSHDPGFPLLGADFSSTC